MEQAVSGKLEQEPPDGKTHEVNMLESTHHTSWLHADWKMYGCTSWKKKGGRAGMSCHHPAANHSLIAHRLAPSLAPPDIVGKNPPQNPQSTAPLASFCDLIHAPCYILKWLFRCLFIRGVRCSAACSSGLRCPADCCSQARDVLPPAHLRCAVFRCLLISGAQCHSAGLLCRGHRYASSFLPLPRAHRY